MQDFATAEDLFAGGVGGGWGGKTACLSEAVVSHPLFSLPKIALHGYIMATFICRVQFLDDTDPFNSTNFPEPTRPPLYTFREDIPLINQIAGVHRLLQAPHKVCSILFNLLIVFLFVFL